jgi:hypothetical protein
MKRRLLGAFLILTIIATGGYSYYQIAYSKCRVPLSYDIGSIDERFNITPEEARAALSDAESLWEDATGKNLFTWKEKGSLVVNFEYDERQATTEKQHQLSDLLDQKAEMSESIKADYERLRSGYETLRAEHEERLASYERRLAAHNALVEEWNTKGGAPTNVYQDLKRTSEVLNTESAELNKSAKTLNDLVAKINEIGSRGNQAVEEYNRDVSRYNDAFADDREFTQGDYQSGVITIYQYDNATELRKVLAHEMGHALGVEHVDEPDAIMYYLMEGQLAELGLHSADVEAYRVLCGTK